MWSEPVGDTFRVFVGHCGPDPQKILFVTDANGLFGLAVETVRLMQIPGLVPSLLVVGVGYPDADTLIATVQIRTRELTPTPSRHLEGSGHADDFIESVASELRPWLTDRYPAEADDVTYFGHSLGGLFGAYSLLTATSTFDRYIVSSPSLWWDDEMIFDLEARRADEDRLHSPDQQRRGRRRVPCNRARHRPQPSTTEIPLAHRNRPKNLIEAPRILERRTEPRRAVSGRVSGRNGYVDMRDSALRVRDAVGVPAGNSMALVRSVDNRAIMAS